VIADAPLINEIRIAVVEAFYSVPRGGVEIGGVFFGRRTDDTLRITAHRPVKCEYVTGPSFSLSIKDQIGLAGVLAGPGNDPKLEGLVPLGWYHSHTRSEIFLSPADLVLYNEFFPERWQIALVLRPANLQPTRGAFFFRDGKGRIADEASPREFVMAPPGYGLTLLEEDVGDAPTEDPGTGETHAPQPPAPAPEAAIPAAAAVVAISPEPAPEPEVEVPHFGLSAEPAVRGRFNWRWLCAFVVVVLLLAGAAAAATFYWSRSSKPAELGLETYDVNGAFLIRWDRESAVVRQASRAVLEIQDGGDKTPVELNRSDLAVGGYGYLRRSGDVSVHMKVEGPIPADEYSNFTGSQSLIQQPQSSERAGKDAELDRAVEEKEHLKTELINESMQTQELRGTVADLKKQLAEARARSTAPTPPQR
jgi:proteasome lid subunit RPN8/RPN11